MIGENILGIIQEQGFLPGQYRRRYDMVVKQVPYSAHNGLEKGQSWPNMISSRSRPSTIVTYRKISEKLRWL
jgi:hypothetical protein